MIGVVSEISNMVTFFEKLYLSSYICKSASVDTGRKLNVHKTFRRRPGRLLNFLYTFNLHPVSTGAGCTQICNLFSFFTKILMVFVQQSLCKIKTRELLYKRTNIPVLSQQGISYVDISTYKIPLSQQRY